ncbi:acetyltransferase [Phaeobacter sp. B1627]|uniref:acetyltransferase n=1 Tax=Phaeobacter sp. B1627 TaxID=2583809 RepID=UPI001C40040B|nr:acetyltransferase [Phaeobacter sp. B1627]
MTEPLDATKADPFAGAPTFSMRNRLERAAFAFVWLLLASWTPPPLRRWRLWILRRFGAQLASTANVYGSARIWLPRNLTMAPHSTLGPGVQCYCMAPIRIGCHVVVSQRAHLCCGTHDILDARFQLRVRPIEIGDDAWICAETFVGPGVKVGAGAVLAARAATFIDLDDWTVYRGNPATAVKARQQFQRTR